MKPFVAVFAHPDDEAFGPAGKIAIESKKRDTYIICVTNGAAGQNSTKSRKELSEIRKKELRSSAKILGVKKVIFLEYKDGSLCNELYHEIAEKIKKEIEKIRPDVLLTFEPRGVSGHLDHIAVSFITTFVFKKVRSIKKLLYYCIDKNESSNFRDDYFIYFPHGYTKDEIDLSVSVSKVWNTKLDAMRAHRSQKHDAEQIIDYISKRPKLEHFLVKNT